MEIRKHKIEGVWIYGKYNFYVNNKLVAKLRRQLVGLDYAYIYFLPKLYGDEDCTRIDLRYFTNDEVLEKAIKIVKKKLYMIASNILTDIRETNIEK